MGRTIPTVNILVQQETELFLKTYGKGLSIRERELLYDLFQLCKKYIPSISQAVRLVPFHAILISILLEQEREILAVTNEIMDAAPNDGLQEGDLS